MAISGVTPAKTVGPHVAPPLIALGRVRAARHQRGAVLDAPADVAVDAVALLGVDDGTEPGVLVLRVARHVLRDGCGGELHRLVVVVGVHEHPGPRTARLTGVGHHVGHSDLDGLGQVRARQDDVGGLSAQLQGEALDGSARCRAYLPADRGRAGEGDEVDPVLRGQRLPGDRPQPGDEVEHPGGQARFVDGLGEELRDQRGVLRGLEHDSAAGGECGGDLRDDLVKRVVPGRDRSDDSHGLVEDTGVADLLLEGMVGRELRVARADRDGHARVHGVREGQRRAQFRGDGFGDLVSACLQRVAQRAEPGGAFGGLGGGPAGEGRPRRPYGRGHVLLPARRHRGDDRAVGGVADLDLLRTGCGSPFAVDVHTVVCLHGPKLAPLV